MYLDMLIEIQIDIHLHLDIHLDIQYIIYLRKIWIISNIYSSTIHSIFF